MQIGQSDTLTEAIPLIERLGLRHFDPGERFWTPGWDQRRFQPMTVVAALGRDGWHQFDRFVSEGFAREWQAFEGGGVRIV